MDDDPPIRRTTERLEYETPWFRVYFDDVETPRGPGQYGRIVTGKRGAGESVIVAASDPSGRLLFVELYRYPIAAWSLEMPCGYGEPGQSSAETAARELREETGLEAEEIRQVGVIRPNSAVLDSSLVLFSARVGESTPRPEVDEGIRDACGLTRAEVDEAIRAGRIFDGVTLAALTLLDRSANS